MKKQLHPIKNEVKITCVTCGSEMTTMSTLENVKIDICSECHPFYTGKLTSGAKTGRLDRFNKILSKTDSKPKTAPTSTNTADDKE
ncbi:MAG: 50S ribosomal protein L31 [Tenericutes bacterium]|nr:MAG: 50S ribosomal protein L31 [Mycoplasmatota bacterium]